MNDDEVIKSPDGLWSITKRQVEEGTDHLTDYHMSDFLSFPEGSDARAILLGHSMAHAMGMANEDGLKLMFTNVYFAGLVRNMVPKFEFIISTLESIKGV